MTYILTLVSGNKNLSDTHIEETISVLKDTNTDQNKDPEWLENDKALDLFIAQNLVRSQLHKLRKQLAQYSIDVFQVPAENRKKKLMIADMDSTILTSETLDELAQACGLKDEIAKITARAMAGELDFHDAIRTRVQMLKGLTPDDIQSVIADLMFSKGAETVLKTLKHNDVKTILVSGGFVEFAQWAANHIGFDHFHANRFEYEDNGHLSGDVREPIVDAQTKADLLVHYKRMYQFEDHDIMAVGDGSNDVLMLKAAGLGLGYKAKKPVHNAVDNVIHFTDLTSILYVQGYQSHDIIRS